MVATERVAPDEIIQPISANVESEKIDDCLECICESLSQSKIGFQSEKSENVNENDSRVDEGDLTLETSHIFTRTSTNELGTNVEFETNVESDGGWLSSNFFDAGIEPISEIFSQNFQLDDNDVTTAPDIRDEKVASSIPSCTFGIELPGETVQYTQSSKPRPVTPPKSVTPPKPVSPPKYKNYLVLNPEENRANEEGSNEDLTTSFDLPSTTEFNLPDEPPLPFCFCREVSVDKISKKENVNKDRKYYVCATDKCKVSVL